MAIRSKRLAHTGTVLTGPSQDVFVCPPDRVALLKSVGLSVASGAATTVIASVRSSGNGIRLVAHSGAVATAGWSHGLSVVLEPGDALVLTVQGADGGGRLSAHGALLVGPAAT